MYLSQSKCVHKHGVLIISDVLDDVSELYGCVFNAHTVKYQIDLLDIISL